MEILTRPTMPVTYTPLEEQDVIDQPLMADFLPPHIRRLAMAYHDKLRARKADPNRPKAGDQEEQAPQQRLLAQRLHGG
jgi:hypothetical protein